MKHNIAVREMLCQRAAIEASDDVLRLLWRGAGGIGSQNCPDSPSTACQMCAKVAPDKAGRTGYRCPNPGRWHG